MPRWSAPCFISLRLLSLGLCLGRQRVESCTFCMLPHLRLALGADGCSSIAGLEACLNLGGLQVGSRYCLWYCLWYCIALPL